MNKPTNTTWDDIPDGQYVIRALGKNRQVTVHRDVEVIVAIDLGGPTPTVLPAHLGPEAAAKISEQITREGNVTAHEAAVVLHHYGAVGGYPASDFVTALLRAMVGADVGNLARFRAGWPGLVEAVDLAKNHQGGIERLQAIAAGQQVTR